ncbi:thioesterase domain-containing protein [Chroococcidiopsis cubana]|uniref:thioesterase domain-containing protein n=1 Tax=Chroococcidiopsis cubana TaxID=171392 RepID=UPI002ACEB587|nr:thioesterase domain-containing protein [Chroococcidiopsis cubana]
MIRYLKPDQPCYGLQALGIDGRQTPLTSVIEMAALYLKEIQAIQPEGPYFLCGYSFGGMVAFEIAQQLNSKGHRIALLALLDSVNTYALKLFSDPVKLNKYFHS